MNFDFSDDQKLLREQARKFLAEKCPPKAVRSVLEGSQGHDAALWKGIAEMGWMGTAIPNSASWRKNWAGCWRRFRSPRPFICSPRRF